MSGFASARKYWLSGLILTLATGLCLCNAGVLTPDQYHDYKSGELVVVSDELTVVVPAGYDALWHRASLDRYDGPGVSLKTAGQEVTHRPAPDMISVDTITSEQLAWWSQTDEHFRSIESTGVYDARFETLDLGDGWSATVTTRYEERPNVEPVCIMLANLSHDSHPPLRIATFYHETSASPDDAPDPRRMFMRVKEHITLALP